MSDNTNLDIRPMAIQDIPALCDMGQDPPETEGYFKKCLEAQNAGDRHIAIIRFQKEREIIAYGMLNMKPRYGLYKKLNIPEIQDLYVCQEKRRQGLGRFMINCLEEKARQKGYKKCGISVPVSPRHGIAQRLYFDCGYRPDGQGITYNRLTLPYNATTTIDDDLCLMLIKDL